MRLKLFLLIAFIWVTINSYGQSERSYSILTPPSLDFTEALGKKDANDNKTGVWKFLRSDGTMVAMISYQNGKRNGNQKRYWENGSIYSTCVYVDGLENGIEKIYMKNGYLAEITSFKNGLKDGEQKEFDRNGDVNLIANYKSDIEHGSYQKFYDGNLEESGNYSDGKKEGKWVTYDEGKIQLESEYKNGIAHGLWKRRFRYDEALIDKVEYEYQMINGEITNPIKVYEYNEYYSENTSKDPDEEYYEVKKYYWLGNIEPSSFDPEHPSGFIKTGEWNMKDMENNLITTIVFDIEGVEETKTIYFRNASIKEKRIYDKGKPKGRKTYFENGNVNSIINYKEGYNKDGEYLEYFENGNPKIIGNYKVFFQVKGYFESYHMGFWKFFYKNGKIKEQGNYVKNSNYSLKGLKDGIWKYYNDEGNLIKTENYSNGIKQ